MRLALVAGVSMAWVPAALGQDAYTDLQGRTWRQLVGTTGATWNQVRAACPTDGSACQGMVGSADLTGWVWASQEDVLGLFAEFAPDIVPGGSVGGPAYTLAGLGFTGTFVPTSSTYTIVGGFFYLGGWSSTQTGAAAYAPDVSASYNPHNAGFSVLGTAGVDSASQYRGVWLYRPPAGCAADINADGSLNFFDLSAFVALFNAQNPDADLNGDGGLSFFDVSAYLALYNAGCP